MSEPANPPAEAVARDDLPDTHAGSAAGPAAAPVAVPESPISLKPPNARPTPPALEADTPRIVIIGTALWFIAFVALLPFQGRLEDDGRGFWVWTCLAGGLLGLLGLFLARRAARAATR